jgi:uncharacterized membrane protein
MTLRLKLNQQDKIVLALLVFSFALLAARMLYSQQIMYGFYAWNTILALVPYWCSQQVSKASTKIKRNVLLMLWLLFLPNAPYLLTDVLHLENRYPIPFWFDVLLVIQFAFLGMFVGFLAIKNVEHFLQQSYSHKATRIITNASFLLCAYGIYLGRFIRFNSWDFVANPFALIEVSVERIINPMDHLKTWSFTLIVAFMLMLFYYTVKSFKQ